MLLFSSVFSFYHLLCIRPVPASHRVGLARLRLPAVLCLAVGMCCSAPLLLLTCHSHVARSVFPLSRWLHHATAPWFSSPSAHTYPRTHSQPHLWTCDGVRPCEMRAPTCKSSRTRTEEFCLWKERMANSRQLEALKTINYRVTRLKESERAALCSFPLWERGLRICQNCCADQQTAK